MHLELELFQGIIINTSILLLVTHILTKINIVRHYIFEKQGSFKMKIVLIIIFGFIAIISTYSGTEVQGAIVNIRVVSVLGSGLLFGPFVGIGTGIIAGIHRYFVDTADFTNLACAVSTVLEGFLGGYFYMKFRSSDQHQYSKVFLVGVVAECMQMVMILLIAKPFDNAWELVQIIAIPMILLNSLGVVLFISIFDSVFIWQERQSAKKIELVLTIAEKCLPYLRKGLYNTEQLNQAASIIFEKSSAHHIVITDLNNILASSGDIKTIDNQTYLELLKQAKSEINIDNEKDKYVLVKKVDKYHALIAPLTANAEITGFLFILTPINYMRNELMIEFTEGLAKLMSTQLELSQIDIQKQVVKKAEFDALQSQINPHFIFNVLTTIISISRQDPDKARELLVSMSSYFRFVLKTGYDLISLDDEMSHVKAYITLEKARFEDKLDVQISYNADGEWLVPRFIIQPLVENAIKHGIQKKQNQQGKVSIDINQYGEMIIISIEDDGVGINSEIINQLYNETIDKEKVGLFNVHQRLLHFYGEGVTIKSNQKSGSVVSMKIFKEPEVIL